MYSDAITLDRPLKDNGQWMNTVKIFTTTWIVKHVFDVLKTHTELKYF